MVTRGHSRPKTIRREIDPVSHVCADTGKMPVSENRSLDQPCVQVVWAYFVCRGGAERLPPNVGNSQRGGGQNVSCDFGGGGGGGKRTIKHPLQNQFWRRPQKVGFVWSVPVSSKENDIA